MGADFLFIYLAVPLVDGECIELRYDKAFEAIDTYDWTRDEDLMYNWGCGEGIDDIRSQLRAAVESLKSMMESGRNDTSDFDRGGDRIFLTGGMSWGDPPTDFYDTLTLLAISKLDEVLIGKKNVMGTNVVRIRVDQFRPV